MSDQPNILNAIKTVVQEEMRPFKDEIKKDITTFKDEILTSNDKISKKLDIIISELPSINEKQRNHTDRLGTLEIKTAQIQAHLGI